MRILVDNPLSPRVADRLREAGHDALHVRDVGMGSATDVEIIEFAEREDRIVVSADTDFGALLALHRRPKSSFVLLRGSVERRPEAQAALLIRELPKLENHLLAGAIVVITRDRIRIRRGSTSAD